MLSEKSVWVRIPIIPTINDSAEEMTAIRRMLDAYPSVKNVELLPYHVMGEHKYDAIGQKLRAFSVPDDKTIAELKKCFTSN